MSAVSFWLIALVAIAGAWTVLVARETIRLIAGLGTFLLGIAGLYLRFAMPLLAASQVFLYVGGVLALFLFAIMALRRDEDRAGPAVRFSVVHASVAAGIFAVLVTALRDVGAASVDVTAGQDAVDAVGALLLGRFLPAFELVGGLLFVALVAVLAISAGEDRR